MDKDIIEPSKVEDRMDGLEKSSGREGETEATEEEEEVMLPGFRFHPTDEELVGFYLRRKVEKKTLSMEIIKQIDIYKYDPWDLPKVSTVGEKEWYFFCLRGRKYRNSIRPNRVTCSGFWKATGIDRPIHLTVNANECIGLKKSLVYYRGSAGKGTKTDWMMHEFRLPSSAKSDNTDPSTIQEAENWTICRILKRSVTYKKCSQAWRGTAYKQIPDSSSKTNSYESEPGDEYKYFAASTIDQDERMATGYNFGSQWIPVAQAQTSTIPQIQNQSMSGMYREGNWNEFAKMTENVIDPAFAYECRYS